MADIQLTDITQGSLVVDENGTTWTGTGIFDKLISAVNSNIVAQYDSGRIQGTDFAQVYLNSIQSVLQVSVDFALREKLTEKQIELAEKDLLLKDAQLVQTGVQTDAMLSETGIKEAQAGKDLLLKDVQITAVTAETALKEVDSAVKNSLLEQQRATEVVSTLKAQYDYDQLMPKQADKLSAEVQSIFEKDRIASEMATVDNILKTNQASMVLVQSDKMNKEIDSMGKEDARRDAASVKDIQLKDAQKSLTYREALIKEQQQALLANQTQYEAEKTVTLRDNTKANMLIRLIDSGATEVQGWLSSVGYVDKTLLRTVAQARLDLIKLGGMSEDDYTSDYTTDIVFSATTGTATGTTARNTKMYGRLAVTTVDVQPNDIFSFDNIVYRFKGTVAASLNVTTCDLTNAASWEIV